MTTKDELDFNSIDVSKLKRLTFEQKYSIKEVAKILGLELTYVEHKLDDYNNNLNNKIKELEELGYTITKK